jgi:hypothetical protein
MPAHPLKQRRIGVGDIKLPAIHSPCHMYSSIFGKGAPTQKIPKQVRDDEEKEQTLRRSHLEFISRY